MSGSREHLDPQKVEELREYLRDQLYPDTRPQIPQKAQNNEAESKTQEDEFIITPDLIAAALTPEDDEISTLTEIATHFRETLGGKIKDDVALRALRITPKIDYTKRNEIPRTILRSYGRALMGAARAFATAGRLRKATYDEIKAVRGINETYATFLFEGFKTDTPHEA